jgi:hypothetical protein
LRKRELHLDQFGQFQEMRKKDHAAVCTAYCLHLVYAAHVSWSPPTFRPEKQWDSPGHGILESDEGTPAYVVNALLTRHHVFNLFGDLLLFLFSHPYSISFSTLLCILGFFIFATAAKHSAYC